MATTSFGGQAGASAHLRIAAQRQGFAGAARSQQARQRNFRRLPTMRVQLTRCCAPFKFELLSVAQPVDGPRLFFTSFLPQIARVPPTTLHARVSYAARPIISSRRRDLLRRPHAVCSAPAAMPAAVSKTDGGPDVSPVSKVNSNFVSQPP